jgi:predicted HicB family RNase H-like nuclease
MGLIIEKEEFINKTFRLNKKLIDEMYEICHKKNISLNKLVEICIRYALENVESGE